MWLESVVLRKVLAIFPDVFLRRYPWQIHFFYETLSFSEVRTSVQFLLEEARWKEEHPRDVYEKSFAEQLGGGSAFALGAGRMALYAILEALGIGSGDAVLVPAFTCEVVIFSLLYRGITPVYVDIDPETLNCSLQTLRRAYVKAKNPKAVIAQHTFAVPAPMEDILDFARRKSLYVIEDCALSMGGLLHGKPLGTWGDAALFSTDRTKDISTYVGGVAFTKQKDLSLRLAEMVEQYPTFPLSGARSIAFQIILSYFLLSPFNYYWGKYLMGLGYRSGLFFYFTEERETFLLPSHYPCRLSSFQAALGVQQLKKLPVFRARRRKMVKRYVEILEQNGVSIHPEGAKMATLRFSLFLKGRESFVRRFGKYFEVGNWFECPAHGFRGDFRVIGYAKNSAPQAEFVHRHIVNFPTLPRYRVLEKYLEAVVETIQPSDIAHPPKNAALSIDGNGKNC